MGRAFTPASRLSSVTVPSSPRPAGSPLLSPTPTARGLLEGPISPYVLWGLAGWTQGVLASSLEVGGCGALFAGTAGVSSDGDVGVGGLPFLPGPSGWGSRRAQHASCSGTAPSPWMRTGPRCCESSPRCCVVPLLGTSGRTWSWVAERPVVPAIWSVRGAYLWVGQK